MIYEKTAESSLNAPGRYNLGEISAAMGERVAAGFKRGFGRARSWRVPPNWSMTDWHDELRAISIMTAWQAMQEYDPLCGVSLDGFVYCRIKSHSLTRYRQEWRYALRIAPTDSKIIERLAGADPAANADRMGLVSLELALGRLSENEFWLLDQIFRQHRTETNITAELHISQPAVNKRKRFALDHLRGLL